VRNSYYTLNEKRPPGADAPVEELDALVADGSPSVIAGRREPDPDASTLRAAERERVDQAIARLPDEFREVLVLRRDRGTLLQGDRPGGEHPIGTVMSRLSRARNLLRTALGERITEEQSP
jgi:RNA polymerase sigma-70 factor (ECF subfamily)